MIQQNKWYKPKEIAEQGWISSMGSSMGSHYNFIKKEIREGRLPAKNYARGPAGMQYYKVLGKDIIEYLKKY